MILEAELGRIDATTAIFRLTGRRTFSMRLRKIESTVTDIGVELCLVAPSDRVLEVLKMTCTDTILPIDPNLYVALAA